MLIYIYTYILIYMASFIIAYSQFYGEVSKFHHPAHAVKKIISVCFVICNICLCYTDFICVLQSAFLAPNVCTVSDTSVHCLWNLAKLKISWLRSFLQSFEQFYQ